MLIYIVQCQPGLCETLPKKYGGREGIVVSVLLWFFFEKQSHYTLQIGFELLASAVSCFLPPAK